MPMVPVHNISDRPNTGVPAKAVTLGGRKLRPGKHMLVDLEVLNAKHVSRLHGSCIWIGPLPARFTRTSKSARGAEEEGAPHREERPMGFAEARAYLEALSFSDLYELREKMSPPLVLTRAPTRASLAARMSRVLFRGNRELDPDAFFWLRRWRRTSHGDFYPVEG